MIFLPVAVQNRRKKQRFWLGVDKKVLVSHGEISRIFAQKAVYLQGVCESQDGNQSVKTEKSACPYTSEKGCVFTVLRKKSIFRKFVRHFDYITENGFPSVSVQNRRKKRQR